MKKTKIAVIGVIVLAILALGVYATFDNGKFGMNSGSSNYVVLAGTSPTGFVRIPNAIVSADSTTTVTTLEGSIYIGTASTTGGTVNQFVEVNDFTDYTVYANLRGGTATSTFCVRPEWSFDGVNFYPERTSATSTSEFFGTSTPALATQSICNDPGTATTTFVFSGTIPAAKSARFMLWGEDVATDPVDGVEGYVIVNLKNPN